jgi:hypothetical protein
MTIKTINLTLEHVGAQEPLHIPHSTQINAIYQHDVWQRIGSNEWQQIRSITRASVPDHVNLAWFVAGKQCKPKCRTSYIYRKSALSAAGAIMYEYIQREWENLQVKQHELVTHTDDAIPGTTIWKFSDGRGWWNWATTALFFSRIVVYDSADVSGGGANQHWFSSFMVSDINRSGQS